MMKFAHEWQSMDREIQQMLRKLTEYIAEQARQIQARNARIQELTDQLAKNGTDDVHD